MPKSWVWFCFIKIQSWGLYSQLCLTLEDKISILHHFWKDAYGHTTTSDLLWVPTFQGPHTGKSEERTGLKLSGIVFNVHFLAQQFILSEWRQYRYFSGSYETWDSCKERENIPELLQRRSSTDLRHVLSSLSPARLSVSPFSTNGINITANTQLVLKSCVPSHLEAVKKRQANEAS